MSMIRSLGNVVASAYLALASVFILLSVEPVLAAQPTPVVAQSPLAVGGNVPGNLLLVPSVEWPTIDSVANIDSTYVQATEYVGYFDSDKCYLYSYSVNEPERHFYPSRTTTSRNCSNSGEWSGNFLNWTATQTIDPFRKALTGGHRVVDTATETWLEKARYDGNGGNDIFPNRRIPNSGNNSTMVSDATPASWNEFHTRIWQLGNRMRFSGSGGGLGNAPTPYNPDDHETLSSNTTYEVSVRVKVCDPEVGVEANCKRYGSNYKPEGLIQQYAGRMRYSAFGFLNDPDALRDGGVLRARQKFVGPTMLTFSVGSGWEEVENPAHEWDADTGILRDDPDPLDSAATTAVIGDANYPIRYSGVINYINKFGQMTTGNHKSHDPVSELYYTAIRYLKALGNVPEYTSLSGTGANRYNWADGFPVITSWDDPIQYACQNNAILGIGDVNTHRDKNLPGSGTSGSGEPSKPAAVIADNTINVRTATERVFSMEGLTVNTGAASWSGRDNSAFIAGLAYDSRTMDLRPDATYPTLPGKQTVSTYWVDVREARVLQPPANNQYWLAAKYGGFTVPPDFNPYTANSLPTGSWESEETLTHNNGVVRVRPRNFYVASQANEMISSLNRAFANIVMERYGSAASLAANSTRLDTETRTFQAQFRSGVWSGELNAYSVDPESGALSASPVWSATQQLASATWSARTIHAANDSGTALVDFTPEGLSSTQFAHFGPDNARRTAVVNYLRGERSNEEALGGVLRSRATVLGDIVNSTPLFIGPPNAAQHAGRAYAGGSEYVAWATNSQRANRTPIVYVGANDGMLHAFNANNGEEVFSFVPNTVIANGLADYASPTYEHRYYVDGETAAAEIYDASIGQWRTVLVGTLGRGGPGLFALDVTNPGAPAILWEKDGSDIPELGRNIGRPVIAQVASGDWRVLLGNGPDSGAGAYMISVTLGGLDNGTVNVFAADTTAANGMTALLVRDTNLDSYADTVYAGDLEGTVWRISNIGGSPGAAVLFQARDSANNPQPITAAPMVGRDPQTGNVWVFVGTGKYLNVDDISDDSVQTWYGLIDDGTTIANRSQLVEREILAEVTVAGVPARVVEAGTTGEIVGTRGWYMDLVSPGVDGQRGERMVVQNRFQGDALIGTSRIPEYVDACNPGGSGYIMAINPFSGARLTSNFFDMNGDGISNDSDKYCDAEGNCVPVTGIGFESSPNNPIFIENVMQVGLDSGETATIETFGSAVEASRMSWRELFND